MLSTLRVRAPLYSFQICKANLSTKNSLFSRSKTFIHPPNSQVPLIHRFHSSSSLQSELKRRVRNNTLNPRFKRYLSEAGQVLKYAGAGILFVVFVGLLSFQGVHYYVEWFLCPTPSALPRKERDLLRFAYLLEEVYPDLNLAQKALGRVLEVARHDQELPVTNPIVSGIMLRMANNAARIGNLYESHLTYQEVFRALVADGGEENLQKAVDIAKKAANISLRMRDYYTAEKYYIWIITTLSRTREDQVAEFGVPISDRNIDPDLVQASTLLAGIYAKQKRKRKKIGIVGRES